MEKQLRTLLSQTEGATLDLSNLSLKAQDVDALVSLLLNDKQFRSLKLNGYHIGDEGAIHLSRLLLHQRSSGPLLRLSLSAGGEGRHTLELVEAERRDIGERGGLALARALCFNSSLERLDLQNNSLRATGNPSACPAVQLMARALSVNQYLTHLDLSGNKLSSEEVIILANSWRRNHALVKVSFAKSRINKPCHIFIADCLKTNAVMEVVDFKGSATASYSLSDVCQIYIDMLAVNTTLLEIKLPAPLAVREDAHKAKQMAELLERNRRMTKEREALYKRQAQMGSSRLTGSVPAVTNSGRMSLDKISTARSGDYEGRGRATNSGRFPRVNSSSSSPVPSPADSRRGSYSSSFSSSFDPSTGDGPPAAAASLLTQRKATIEGEGGKKMIDDGESSNRSRSESLQEQQDNSSSSEDVNNTNKRPERQMVLAKLGSAFSGTATDVKDVSTCVLYELTHEPLDRIDISRMNLRTFSMEDVEYIVAHHGDLIKELFLFHNRLKELPRNIGKLRGLTVLDLCGNHISNLPNELDCMCSLQRLDVSHNKLKDLPSLPSLTQLRRVFLNHNDFAYLPEAIMNLTGLRTLDVSFNNIKVLPPSIANLQELKYFYLENNQLTTICREIGVLTNLLELRLEYNCLEFLPVELAHIPSLKKICLRGNPLSTITGRLDPKSNKKNNNTEDLIERVGASLASTSSPTSFHFPTSSSSSSTSSSSSSSSSHKDKNHSSSDLTLVNERESEKERKDNNVGDKESGDDSDADNDLKWVRTYLHSLEEQSKSFMRVKLMLVGEGGVGKTSLLRCFREKKKSKEKNPNIATDGIDIADTQWANISFRAWDFAGQDLYQTTHQFFLSKRSIYLLVFNLADAYRESTRKLDYWLYSLKARVPGVPVIIVGTHLDHKALQPKKKKGGDTPVADILEKISKRYKRRFPNVADIVAVSCKTKRGIKELKSKIATVAEKKKFVRLTIPSPFLIFSKFVTVLAMPGSFLYPPITKKAKFRKQAKSFNVENGEFEDLLIFLNDIGDIAYFGDDPSEELSDYVFLDPQWLTKVMSSVVTLRHQVVRGDDGKLRRSDLGLIWRAPAFPESIHHILIQLLRKFDILYPWSKLSGSMASSSSINASKNASDSCLDSGNWKTGSPGKTDETETSKMDEDFLVPCLLKKERPFTVKKEWPHFEPEDVYDQIGRQWVFRFLPLGFFSRLFVRTLHVIQDWDIHKARLKRRSRNNSNASSNNSSSPSQRSTSAKSLNTTNSARWRLEAVRGQGAAELAAYWTNGVIVKVMKRGKNLEKGFLEYIPEEFLLKLHVRSQRGRTSKLFALLVENIESLLDGWYQNQVKEVLISCPHCIRLRVHPPNLFPLQEAEVAVAQGLPFLLCADEKVTIDQMAPDISLVHMEAFIIKPAEVKLLEEVGKGAYATVYRGILDGQEVAVKKINFSADTAALSSSTACSPSLASTPLPASSTIRNAAATASSPCPAASASTSSGHSAAAEGSLPSKLNNVTAMAELSEKFQELRREVLLMSTLNHPNTVGLKGICLSLPSFLILTEFLPYGNLYDFIHKATGALDWGLRLRIVRDVAEGMNFLHSTIPPTIHRDLKTPNVLMASTSSSAPTVAKVADFGLSTQMTEARMKGRNVWNPVWLAPEIMQNKEYTEKADVYSFGIIMWEVISLQHPFKEYTAEYDADSRLEDAIIQGLRPSVTFPEASESPEYMSLMQACWDDDPSARPDFATIIQRLEVIQRQLAPDTLSPYELASREAAMATALSPSRQTKHLGSVMLGNRRVINSNNSISNENETSPRKTMKDDTGGAEQRNGMLSSASSSSSPRSSSSPTKGKNKKKNSDDGSGSAADDYSGMKKPTLCSSKVPSTPVCMAVVRSDEGLSVWVGCEDGLVVRCNPKTGEVLDSTKAHKGPVVSIVQSGLPSRYVWTCSPDDSNVLCWDPKKFKSKKLKMGKKAGVSTLSYYHPSHIWAALLDDVCTLALIDVNEQKVALYLSAQKDGAANVKRATAEKSSKKGQSSKNAKSNNSVTCICSIGTNMWVASGANIYIWSCEQKPEILDRMEGKAKDERFTYIQKVGQEVWSCTDKRNIYIWSLEGELLHSIAELPTIPNSLIWLPLSKLVWFAASNSLFVYDAKTYKEVERTIVDPKNDIAAFLLINKNTVWGVSKAGSIHVFSLNLSFRQDTSFRLLEAH